MRSSRPSMVTGAPSTVTGTAQCNVAGEVGGVLRVDAMVVPDEPPSWPVCCQSGGR